MSCLKADTHVWRLPQCALLASNLADSLRLTLDQFGNVVGVDYRTATADCGSATGEQPTVPSINRLSS